MSSVEQKKQKTAVLKELKSALPKALRAKAPWTFAFVAKDSVGIPHLRVAMTWAGILKGLTPEQKRLFQRPTAMGILVEVNEDGKKLMFRSRKHTHMGLKKSVTVLYKGAHKFFATALFGPLQTGDVIVGAEDVEENNEEEVESEELLDLFGEEAGSEDESEDESDSENSESEDKDTSDSESEDAISLRALATLSLEWRSAKISVVKQLGDLKSKVKEEEGSTAIEEGEPSLEEMLAPLEEVMDNFHDDLEGSLDRLVNMNDEQRVEEIDEVSEISGNYLRYLKSSKLVAHIDANPYSPVRIIETLQPPLKKIRDAVGLVTEA